MTGIAHITARRQYAARALPAPTYWIGWLLTVGESDAGTATGVAQGVAYAGMSSVDQMPDLDRQVARLTAAQGRRLLVVDPVDVDDDLVRELTEVLTSLCARLYGRQAPDGRVHRAVEAVTEAPV